jgi:hypothetical protein
MVRRDSKYDERKLLFSLSDFQIREANALPIAHTYTVMCVLPINLFNQVLIVMSIYLACLFYLSIANIYIFMVLVHHCYPIDTL